MDTPQDHRDFWSLAPARTEGEARQLVRRGSWAGYALAAMSFLSAVLILQGAPLGELEGLDRESALALISCLGLIVAALAYRFGRKGALWIPAVLLGWHLFEVIDKLQSGQIGLIFSIASLLIVWALIGGIQGARYIKTQAGLAP